MGISLSDVIDMEENAILYIEVPDALNQKLEEITSGPNRHYSSKSEFVRAAIREKLDREKQ